MTLEGDAAVQALGKLLPQLNRFGGSRERVSDVVTGGDGLTPWGDRLTDLGTALASAVRHQSIENAPLLIFAAVGAVLFVFMLKV